MDGVGMGYPLGQTLFNAFLGHFEKKWLPECLVNFLLNVYKGHIDGIFVTFDSYK